MACGTGKTLVCLRVYERIAPDLAVVLVPSLGLMSETILAWTANATSGFRYLPVCSDVLVTEDVRPGEDRDITVGDLAVLDARAITDTDGIARFLHVEGPKVVFCTYQSSDVLADAAATAGVRFGLIVADEAHRTTGPSSSLFATALDDTRLPADRRLFVTATPRTFSTAADGAEIVHSMDNPDVYGDTVHQLGFGAAVELALLADYEVVVIAVDNAELRATILEGGSLELEGADQRIDASALVALEASLRAIDEFDMTKLISFHSRIKRAQDFASAMDTYQRWRRPHMVAEADTVNGTMNASYRKGRISWLKTGDSPRLLTNARCLTEGIDVPSLDGIVFADPRRSQIDIVQAVGRVMRIDPNNPSKIGRIIIPVVVPDPDVVDADNVFEGSAFRPVWDVIRALKAHDFRLETELNRLRGLTALGPVDERDFRLSTRLRVVGVEELEAFQLAVLKRSAPNFWWYLRGPVQQFADREGHTRVNQSHVERFKGESIRLGSWVAKRRREHRKGLLSADYIAELEALPGWQWDTVAAKYERGLGALRQYASREGHSLVPDDHIETFEDEEFKLGKWVGARRQDQKRGALAAERIVGLEAVPGWEWDAVAAEYQRGLGALRQYAFREGHSLVPAKHSEDFAGNKIKLGMWVSRRRSERAEGELSVERALELETLPGWDWDPKETDYQHRLAALLQFVTREGHSQVATAHVERCDGVDVNLGVWVARRRAEYRTGALSEARADELEALPAWTWNQFDATFERFLAALSQYADREGHTLVPAKHVEGLAGERIRLGSWVSARRSGRARGTMSALQAAELESFPGWEWDPKEIDYQRSLSAVRQYVAREGHALVPTAHFEEFEGDQVAVGQWIASRRWQHKKGTLSAERAEQLEALPGWAWDAAGAKFMTNLTALRQFAEREGHLRIPSTHVEVVDGNKVHLDNWVRTRRAEYHRGKLAAEQIALLEALPGWKWRARTPAANSHSTAT